MTLIRLTVIAMSLTPGLAIGQQALLTTAVGRPYDELANCLVNRMAPRLTGAPVVRPPPANRAEVHLYIHGTRDTGQPVASFIVSQLDDGKVSISFEEQPGHRGKFTAAASAAAQQCSR